MVGSPLYPFQTNPIGLSVVRLLRRRENVLDVEGVDILDVTSLLDIKPYAPNFDIHPSTHTGWCEKRSQR